MDSRKVLVRVLLFLVAVAIPYIIIYEDGEEWSKDSGQDWVTLKAGWSGLDITDTNLDLAGQTGAADLIYPNAPSARPPGFFVMYAPGLVSQTGLVVVVGVLNALSFAYLSRGSVWVGSALLLLLTESIAWVNPATTWAGLIALTWTHLEDRWQWGIPLGVAAAVRLWPLLPVVFLLMIRRRVGTGALVTFAALTVGGLLIVSPDAAVQSILNGGEWMDASDLANISMSRAMFKWAGVPVVLTVVVGSTVALALARRMSPFTGYGLTVLAGVVLSPLGWPAYLSSTAPAWKWPVREESPASAPEGEETGDQI